MYSIDLNLFEKSEQIQFDLIQSNAFPPNSNLFEKTEQI